MAKDSSEKLITDNKKARFDYIVEETFEAGIQLTGSEVKSMRQGQVNLKDSYIAFVNGEAYLQNAHISIYRASSYNNHEPERLRKLLMHKIELEDIERSIREKGYTCIALRLYFKNSRVKIEIGLAKGRKHGDKRSLIKERDIKREISKEMSKTRLVGKRPRS
jgi:SsrA-binding protein